MRSGTRIGWALVAALVALGGAASASGHGKTYQLGFVSTVLYLDPLVLGLDARVVGGDDRLRVANLSDKTVVILGYEGEPYLRFTRRGVFENVHSPSMYRNRDRWGVASVPSSARAGARPLWRRVGIAPSYAWHDHRIQWMRRGVLPAIVRAAPRARHKVFSWGVPGRADGRPFTIRGSLGYAPRPVTKTADDSASTVWWLAGAAVVAVALGAVVVFLRRIAP